MRKKALQETQKMSVAAAREMTTRLVQRESRGPGDLDNAMRRLEAKYGIPYGALWSLRYRPPQDILMGVFSKIKAAYQAECARQISILEHEINSQEAIGNDVDPDLVAEIEALARKIKTQKLKERA